MSTPNDGAFSIVLHCMQRGLSDERLSVRLPKLLCAQTVSGRVVGHLLANLFVHK